jgi:hypothetical protein
MREMESGGFNDAEESLCAGSLPKAVALWAWLKKDGPPNNDWHYKKKEGRKNRSKWVKALTNLWSEEGAYRSGQLRRAWIAVPWGSGWLRIAHQRLAMRLR